MAIPAWIPYAISGAGSIANMFGAGKGAKSYRRGVLTRVDTQKERLMAGSPWEQMLAQFAQGISTDPTYNAGNDALMQYLRVDPTTRMDLAGRTLEEIMAGGNAFNTTPMFEALGAQDARARAEALATLQASAGSIGRRFGTGMMGQTGNMLSRMYEDAAARNAGIAMQSHEAAQGRRLNAAQLMNQRNAGMMDQYLQAIGLSQAGQQQRLGAAQAGAQAWMGREGMIAQLLGILNGVPAGGGSGVGQGLQDIGGLMMFYQLMSQRNAKRANG